jgi:hypothetical protein
MKYISMDLETTCIDPKIPENVLQMSLVVEDTQNPVPVEELPHFTCFIKSIDNQYTGQASALGMNGWIFNILCGRTDNDTGYPILYQQEAWLQACAFVDEHFRGQSGRAKGVKIAGKNVGIFDMQFIPKELMSRFSAKSIDPTSMFIDWKAEKPLLSLGEIKKKLDFDPHVAHDAREDALDVIKVLRTTYNGK